MSSLVFKHFSLMFSLCFDFYYFSFTYRLTPKRGNRDLVICNWTWRMQLILVLYALLSSRISGRLLPFAEREYLQTVGLLLSQLLTCLVWCVLIVTQPVLTPCYPSSINFHCLPLSLKSNFKGIYLNDVLVHSVMLQEMQQ